MDDSKEIKLASGSVLKIMHVPFSEAKALYQALLEEAKSIAFDSKKDIASLMKDVLCMGFSSRKVEIALEACLKRCLYNGLKIDEKTFEPIEARADYSIVCIEVTQNVIGPFMKGLYAEFGRLLSMIPGAQT